MSAITSISVDALYVDGNPRTDLEDKPLEELAKSIQSEGVLEPIRVSDSGNGRYRIESGQRRWNAATIAGVREVPCVIVEHADAADELIKGVVTNVQRADLNPIDEAQAYLTLNFDHGLTPKGIAERMGVSQARVTQRLELLELPQEVVELIRDGKIPVSCRQSLKQARDASGKLCREVAKAIAGKDEYCAVFAKEPMRVAAWVAQEKKPKDFFVVPGRVELRRLGRPSAAVEEFLKNRGVTREQEFYVPFHEEAIDAARAAGVLYEAKGLDGKSIITSQDWATQYLDTYVESVIKVEAENAARRAEAEARQGKVADLPASEQAAEAEKELRRQEREARAEGKKLARAHNEELGTVLLTKGASIPTSLDMNAAWAFALALVGGDLGGIFRSGLAVCLPDYYIREQTKKGEKITYLTGIKECEAKGFEWLSRASTPDEVIGRATCLALAAMYADQGVHPESSQGKGEAALPSMAKGYGDNEGGVPAQSLIKRLEGVAKDIVPPRLRKRGRANWPSQKPLNEFRERVAAESK